MKLTPVTCGHPDSKHHAKGMCKMCYRRSPVIRKAIRRWYLDNREIVIARTKLWHQGHPEANIDTKRKIRYGLSKDDYRSLFNDQRGRCAICTEEIEPRKLHVDHDHKTGRVRGLLCAQCNHVLGNAHDRVDVLESAIRYLKK